VGAPCMPDLFLFYLSVSFSAYLMTSLVFFKARTGSRKRKKFAKTLDKPCRQASESALRSFDRAGL